MYKPLDGDVHDYTRPLLFSLLALRQFLWTDDRGVVALVAEWRELREVLGHLRGDVTRGVSLP